MILPATAAEATDATTGGGTGGGPGTARGRRRRLRSSTATASRAAAAARVGTSAAPSDRLGFDSICPGNAEGDGTPPATATTVVNSD